MQGSTEAIQKGLKQAIRQAATPRIILQAVTPQAILHIIPRITPPAAIPQVILLIIRREAVLRVIPQAEARRAVILQAGKSAKCRWRRALQ